MAWDSFRLELELGNAAMSEPADVAEALEEVAARLRDGYVDAIVRDVNGNTVGRWELEAAPDPLVGLVENPPAGAVAVRDLYRLGSNYDVERSPWSLFVDLIGWSEEERGAPLLEAPAGDFGYLELSELGAALVEYAAAPDGVRSYVRALMAAGSDG